MMLSTEHHFSMCTGRRCCLLNKVCSVCALYVLFSSLQESVHCPLEFAYELQLCFFTKAVLGIFLQRNGTDLSFTFDYLGYIFLERAVVTTHASLHLKDCYRRNTGAFQLSVSNWHLFFICVTMSCGESWECPDYPRRAPLMH